MNFLSGIKNAASYSLDIIYPNLCCICKTDLNSQEKFVCLTCSYNLPYIDYSEEQIQKLEKIFWGRIGIENVYSLFNYQKGNQVSTLLMEIKYKARTKTAQHFGRMLQEHIPLEQIDHVIPLPLHPKKEKQRGYNQSLAIAQGIVSGSDTPINKKVVKRISHNDSQTLFSKYDRWENVRSIFQLTSETDLIDKHVLLVDDVLTTGATLEACAHELQKVKGCKVSVATLAVRL